MKVAMQIIDVVMGRRSAGETGCKRPFPSQAHLHGNRRLTFPEAEQGGSIPPLSTKR